MSVFQSHIRSAEAIISGYNGSIPFASYLKQYFSKHSKFGSRDRRQIGQYCYGYFRVRNLFPSADFNQVILNSIFLTETSPHPELSGERNTMIHLRLLEKCSLMGIHPQENFPFSEELSPVIDKREFSLSLLCQPALFIRLRPGHEKSVKAKLSAAGIVYQSIGDTALSLEPQVKLQSLLDIDREAVVQDLQSQRVFDQAGLSDLVTSKDPLRVWDCCAGSGGKTILLHDLLTGRVEVTATDVRNTILHNYKNRMLAAGVTLGSTSVIDLSKSEPVFGSFDLIVADVPCSGSGTWSRTPEQSHFFKAEAIIDYQQRQRRIIKNVLPSLRKGGMFIYITCSVFKKENEDNRQFIEQLGLTVTQEIFLAGMDDHADSMYVSVFRK